MESKIKTIINESVLTKQKLYNDLGQIHLISKVVAIIVTALKNKKRIYLCGNGGSAADAQHIAAELTGRFFKDRKAYPAEALHTNSSYLTAVANDYHFDQVYERLIEGMGQEGDVLVGISTSGNSNNIVLAMKAAQKQKLHTIGLTGESGGKLSECSAVCIKVPSNVTPRIQETHILIGHIICELVEDILQ
jgi:D-sedoheptulose 7-phosphate isomerase